MSTPRLAIEVQNVSGSQRIPSEQLLRSWALAAFTAPADNGAPDATPPSGPGGGELTIRIVGERESADLNSRYRGKRGPTNVLAFMADLPPAPGEETADAVRDVSPPENRAPELPTPSDDAGNTRPRGTLSLRERDGNTLAVREGEAERAEAGAAAPAAGDGNTEQAAREAPPPASDLLPLGDLVICAPVLAREAREQRKPFEAHWAHIVVHGVLHLLGYDHENETQADVMENRERKILAALGFQDPYSVRG